MLVLTYQDFDIPTLTEILKKLLFPPTADGANNASKLPLYIHSVNSWTMSAEVADSFSNLAGNIFLVGDAAHRFPPAGGFGLNTGHCKQVILEELDLCIEFCLCLPLLPRYSRCA